MKNYQTLPNYLCKTVYLCEQDLEYDLVKNNNQYLIQVSTKPVKKWEGVDE